MTPGSAAVSICACLVLNVKRKEKHLCKHTCPCGQNHRCDDVMAPSDPGAWSLTPDLDPGSAGGRGRLRVSLAQLHVSVLRVHARLDQERI